MYAVIGVGGKQVRVSPGETVQVVGQPDGKIAVAELDHGREQQPAEPVIHCDRPTGWSAARR